MTAASFCMATLTLPLLSPAAARLRRKEPASLDIIALRHPLGSCWLLRWQKKRKCRCSNMKPANHFRGQNVEETMRSLCPYLEGVGLFCTLCSVGWCVYFFVCAVVQLCFGLVKFWAKTFKAPKVVFLPNQVITIVGHDNFSVAFRYYCKRVRLYLD